MGDSIREEDTRKLLKYREDLQAKIARLQAEIQDLRKVVSEIDKQIVKHGFRQPIPNTDRESENFRNEEYHTIRSKDGFILGYIQTNEEEITFKPQDDLRFLTSIPPFDSFLVERVLSNMKSADENRVNSGEISPEEVLRFDIIEEDGKILQISIKNYGGERRFREIRSSIRWTFDKMYDKMRQR